MKCRFLKWKCIFFLFDVYFCLFICYPLSLARLLPNLIKGKTVGVVHETRTNYPSIAPVDIFFCVVCVAHPVRFLCCADSFYLSLFCVLCSALPVSLDCPFSIVGFLSCLLTSNTQVKYWKMQEMFFKLNKGLLWLAFDKHKTAGVSSTRYPPQVLRFRDIF